MRVPLAIAHAPSIAPVDENDQQLPHWPWSFTGVTAAFVRQSTALGSACESGTNGTHDDGGDEDEDENADLFDFFGFGLAAVAVLALVLFVLLFLYPFNLQLVNSSCVMSANWLMAILKVLDSLLL